MSPVTKAKPAPAPVAATEQGGRTAPERPRAPPRLRRSRRSRTTGSCPNCHTGALVAPDGAIDWLCVPRFDSPSVFGSLLDRGAGVVPPRPVRDQHPQRPDLRAGHEHADHRVEDPDRVGGGARRTDDGAAPRRGHGHAAYATADGRGRRARARAHRQLHRRQRRRRARVRAGVRLRPRTGRMVGRRRPPQCAGVRRRPDDRAPHRTCCSGSRAPAPARGTRSSAESSCSARCRGTTASPGPRRWSRRTRSSRRPRASGASGSARARIPDHDLRPLIQRSALAIKGLTYMPTGATVAALTTSLPETPGGERNWDYRYTWIRDSTFTLQALHYLNLDWEADEFMQFVADLERNDDGALQIMYGIDGRRDLTETTRDDLSGYAGRTAGPHRQRRLRPAPERRLRRRAGLDPAAHQAQPAAARGGCGRSCSPRPSAPRPSGANPTRGSGRRAASRSTTCPRS